MTENVPVSSAPSAEADTVKAPLSSFPMVWDATASPNVNADVVPSASVRLAKSAGIEVKSIAIVSSCSTTSSPLISRATKSIAAPFHPASTTAAEPATTS